MSTVTVAAIVVAAFAADRVERLPEEEAPPQPS